MTTTQPTKKVLLRAPDVAEQYGIPSTEQVYVMVSRGDLPAPIRLGKRSVAWLVSELDQWLASRVAERDARSVKETVTA